MQKVQILFPDPLIEALRKLARIEDRPVSEILRRGSLAASTFPVFDGGKVLISSTKMKSLIYGDDQP
jgi:hypothetical protein